MDANLYKICRYSVGLLFRIAMYKIAMRTGRDGKMSYVVQKGFKVFGVERWSNVQSFPDYDSAHNLYNRLNR